MLLLYLPENQAAGCANNGVNEPHFCSAASVLLTGLPCCLIHSQSFPIALPLFKKHLTFRECVYVCVREIEIKGEKERDREREREISTVNCPEERADVGYMLKTSYTLWICFCFNWFPSKGSS